MKAVQDSKNGGVALAIGGGNTIDSAIRSQVIGVNNELKGNTYHKNAYYDRKTRTYYPEVNGVSSQYNMIDGYNNTVYNVNHAYVMGANHIILGANHNLANAVILGHNANAATDGGVALGFGSITNRKAGALDWI